MVFLISYNAGGMTNGGLSSCVFPFQQLLELKASVYIFQEVNPHDMTSVHIKNWAKQGYSTIIHRRLPKSKIKLNLQDHYGFGLVTIYRRNEFQIRSIYHNNRALTIALQHKISQQCLTVTNVHLPSRRLDIEGRNQIRQLQSIQKHISGNSSFLLMGDFNSEPHTNTYEYISNNMGLVDVYGKDSPFSTRVGPTGRQTRLDYCFYSKLFVLQTIVPFMLTSDHCVIGFSCSIDETSGNQFGSFANLANVST